MKIFSIPKVLINAVRFKNQIIVFLLLLGGVSYYKTSNNIQYTLEDFGFVILFLLIIIFSSRYRDIFVPHLIEESEWKIRPNDIGLEYIQNNTPVSIIKYDDINGIQVFYKNNIITKITIAYLQQKTDIKYYENMSELLIILKANTDLPITNRS